MKKKIITTIIAVCIIVAVVLVYKLAFSSGAEYVKDPTATEVANAYKMLNEAYVGEGESAEVYYTDFIANSNYQSGEGKYEATLKDGMTVEEYYQQNSENSSIPVEFKNYDGMMKNLAYAEAAEYTVEVEKAGLYYLAMDYIPIGSSLSNFTTSVLVNGQQLYNEMDTICLPILWTDTKEFALDSYGDEMAPSQNRIQEWIHTYLYNNTYVSTTPLCFYLEEGKNTIAIQNVSSAGLAVGKLAVEGSNESVVSYEEYSKQYSNETLVSGDDAKIEINAIDYTKKNSTQAIYGTVSNASLTPFDIDNDKLNTLNWGEAGTEITYEFDVKKTGMYQLGFHYQNGKEEFVAFETIKIDGEVPFKEMYDCQFDPVASGWKNYTLGDKDGNNYRFYLTEGKHTITIKSEISKVMEAYRYALLLQKHITDFELEITKITGTDIDQDRSWKMTKYIPQISNYLDAYSTVIAHIRYLLQDYSVGGNSGAILSYLDKAEVFIEELKKYPNEIALHTTDLTGADNSILVSLSNFTTALAKDKFALDMIYVYGDEKLPRENQSIFQGAWVNIKQLINTFTSDKYSTAVEEKEDDAITVWVNRAITHVDVLQKMCDSEFTPKTGIKVKITTMPDVNKLTLSVAANEAPDAALGLGSQIPFDLSCRGALYDMTNFEDFWNVAARFPSGSFVSYVYNEGVYAIPETTDFNVIVYRTDIFRSLGLEPPQTWDELVEILPTLQRYGMNFYHNIAQAASSYKWFYMTSPMILQNGGTLYTEDGIKTAIDSNEAVKGIQVLGNLFTKYSVETSVNSFFNAFRYSILPIGIIGMEDYTLIKNGAQELDGQWAISPYIGTAQEDGTINRTFVANGTGGAIFGSNSEDKNGPTDKQKKAWEFFKWWTSTEVQTQYTYTLRSTYGKTYFWLPANLEALQNVPMEEADKQVILKQIDYITDVSRTPGQYLLERTISNIWTTMVFDGKPAQVAVDEAVIEVNKEIRRKMKEFGFYDEDGNQIKKYVIRGKDWIQKKQEDAKMEGGVK